jgi:hypothetical protein
MNIQDWIDQEKNNTPELSGFLTHLSQFVGSNGFNASDFERRVNNRLRTFEAEIETSLNPDQDASN